MTANMFIAVFGFAVSVINFVAGLCIKEHKKKYELLLVAIVLVQIAIFNLLWEVLLVLEKLQ